MDPVHDPSTNELHATLGCYQIRIEHLNAGPVGNAAAFPLHAYKIIFCLPFYHDTKMSNTWYLLKLINNPFHFYLRFSTVLIPCGVVRTYIASPYPP